MSQSQAFVNQFTLPWIIMVPHELWINHIKGERAQVKILLSHIRLPAAEQEAITLNTLRTPRPPLVLSMRS
jgi:hypothetical protein